MGNRKMISILKGSTIGLTINHVDKAHGRCGANVRRFYYNFVSGECKEFRYTGCLGNKNNFPSMNVCKRQCHHDWNNFAAMRLVDKKTGKAIVKAHESEKESTFCLGCRSLTLETLEDAEHSDHETTNFFKSELESQNSDCEFQKSLGLPDFIT